MAKQPLTVVRQPTKHVTPQARLSDNTSSFDNLTKMGASAAGSIADSSIANYGKDRAKRQSDEAIIRQGNDEAINSEDANRKRGFFEKMLFGKEDHALNAARDRATYNASARMSTELAEHAANPDNANLTPDQFREQFVDPTREETEELYKGDNAAWAMATERLDAGVLTASRQHGKANIKWTNEEAIRQGVAGYSSEIANGKQQMQSEDKDERDMGVAHIRALGQTSIAGTDAKANMGYKIGSVAAQLQTGDTTAYKIWQEDGVFEDATEVQKKFLGQAVAKADKVYADTLDANQLESINDLIDTGDKKYLDKAFQDLDRLQQTNSGSEVAKETHERSRARLLRVRKSLKKKMTSAEMKKLTATELYKARKRGDTITVSDINATASEQELADNMHLAEITELFGKSTGDAEMDIKQGMALLRDDPLAAARMGTVIRTQIKYAPDKVANLVTESLSTIKNTRDATDMLTPQGIQMLDNLNLLDKNSGGLVYGSLTREQRFEYTLLNKNRKLTGKVHDEQMRLYGENKDKPKYKTAEVTRGNGTMSEWVQQQTGTKDDTATRRYLEEFNDGYAIYNNINMARDYMMDQVKYNDTKIGFTPVKNGREGELALQSMIADEGIRIDGQSMANVTHEDLWQRAEGTPYFNELFKGAIDENAGITSLDQLGNYTMEYDSQFGGLLVTSSKFRGRQQVLVSNEDLVGVVKSVAEEENKIRRQYKTRVIENSFKTTGYGAGADFNVTNKELWEK